MLVERGKFSTSTRQRPPYWPVFAQQGKAVSGPLAADPSVRLCDWNFVTEALAAQKPDWEPGSKHGYHSLTYGFLVGEIIRRVSGRSVGQFVASELARPLGVDFFIGLPTDQKPRVAAPTVQVEPGKPAKPADSGPYAARVFNWSHHRFRCWTSTAMIYGPLKFPQPMALERAIGRQNLRRDYRVYRRHASTVGFLDEQGARATMTRVRRSEGVENALGLGYLLPTATPPLFWTESNWQPI